MTAASRAGDSRASESPAVRSGHLSCRRSIFAGRRAGARANWGARCRRGIAATEFAILAPFLTILILGTFELARGIMVKELLNDAARKGCRTGVQPFKANSDVTAAVNNILTDNGIATSSATITIQVNGVTADCITAKQNDRVNVKVAIPTSATFWVSTYFLKSSTVESDSVSMLRQQ
jgi:Flp pilus assembly protein TadG